MRKRTGLLLSSSILTQTLRKAVIMASFMAIAFLLSGMLFGQGYFGTVSGTLTDSSGAIIQGAKVTLLDEQKGYQFKTTSESSGRYLFASVPPGTYSVIAENPGFEKSEIQHIKVNVSENPTANLTLKVAAETQSVRVEARTVTIATEDAVDYR